MKRFAVIGCIALLAACGAKTDTAAEPAASDSAMAADTASVAAVETPTAGTYDVTNPDGSKGTTTLNADGTYVDHDAAGKEMAKGKYAMKDGKTCFMPDGGKEDCYTESTRAADGSFTATDAKGAVTKVKPQAK